LVDVTIGEGVEVCMAGLPGVLDGYFIGVVDAEMGMGSIVGLLVEATC